MCGQANTIQKQTVPKSKLITTYSDKMERASGASFKFFFARWGFNLSSNVSNTILTVTDYLKSEQPGQAAIVLDALTVLLLAGDSERYTLLYNEECP